MESESLLEKYIRLNYNDIPCRLHNNTGIFEFIRKRVRYSYFSCLRIVQSVVLGMPV